jgi:succinate dehydrogenase / fumarate reductase cytochrome b subunit
MLNREDEHDLMKANSYYFRKLHSLFGVIPVGFFLIKHLLTNYSALDGPKAFIDQVYWLNSLPLFLFLEIFGIWIPLAYHAVYGLYVAYQSRNNVSNYSFFRNQMFFLQRVTGVITFIFVCWHFFETRFQVAIGSIENGELGTTMHGIATNPWMFSLYVVGIVASVFHFSNGMWSFLVNWGITIGTRAQKVSTLIWMAVFVVMTIMFLMSLSAFTGDEFKQVPVIEHVG